MMKNLIGCIVFILSIVSAQFVQAQTLDEIINKNIEAMGGRQKLVTLSSALMTGTFTTPGAPAINIVATKKHMVGSRIDIDVNGTNNYQVITPTNGWIFTPVQGDKEPRPLTDDQFKASQVQLDLQGSFVNYNEKGNKVEMEGIDTVKAAIFYKLKVTALNKNVTVYYIESKSNLILKAVTKMFQFGALEEVATTYSDYKQNADGFWFAYSNNSPRGETRYEKIETNKPVDINIFKIN